MSKEPKSSKIIVAGSLIMDLVVRTPRHAMVGETLIGHDFSTFPGGKGANQAVAAARAGATTLMLGRCGADDFGAELVAFLNAAKVDTRAVTTDPEAATGVAHVAVADDGSNAIIIVPGANANLSPDAVSSVKLAPEDILVAQLEIPFQTIEAFFKAGREMGARTILNAAPACDRVEHLLELTDILVVNEVELAHFAKRAVDASNEREIAAAAKSLQAFDEQIVIVTLGEAGLMGFVDGEVVRVPGRDVTAVDTTGAGDCFTGSLAALLGEGASFETALRFANAAASLSVETPGAGPSMPLRASVDQIIGG